MSHHHDDEVHEHDLGLQHDLGTLHQRGLGRRRMLGLVGGLGVAAVAAGCGVDSADSSGTATVADTSAGRPTPPAGGMGGD